MKMDVICAWITAVLMISELGSRSQVEAATPYIPEASQIFETIFHKYNSKVAPFKDYPNPMKMGIRVTLVKINDLDVLGQSMESIVDLDIDWKDSRLTWYAVQIFKIGINKNQVWVPELSFLNAIDTPVVVSDANLVVGNNGAIRWFRRMKLKTLCATNVTSDSQNCEIVLGSRVYYTKELEYDSENAEFETTSMEPNHKLEVLESSVEFKTYSIDSIIRQGNFSQVHFNLSLQEKECPDCQKHDSAAQTTPVTSGGIDIACIPSFVAFLVATVLSVLH